ncbi:hypothetical protein COW36_06875 [bacterium (Candidatus Blackallbacteria) CG17_big_fil_post_rev_8_21_14_2_50_48_46]|uniref:Uncharacterized protein n=1 Tax=bacterium (Candidatus Blackallbacteria) CG17_big_fil_post_rev_8_21_14_2_50_48_46 TaxID=2014261 RepID=A0A2M7G776_9BACT|nr:MAG: hypothetical protein COW64_05405 [bacterium (Candidatus Blackallbacteria) CG18_big_fil_WC_8_21_14_2_50_49_26]PIW17919.1 MAG: hypothetical protein COW36_06875 [bacterium (Candidatus Blackallbacteria) CG17_big_fil_post_rev_8_21_14_2_50_48_46]PIW45738.1 MAG: hypothetical protein COW20_19055 [bacterium (Candidatus Blackallbacteria) CG13_big_fil_rev_8_21_14_2_50_49_14]
MISLSEASQIQFLETFLHSAGISALYRAVSSESAFEHLLIVMAAEMAERPARLYCVNSVLQALGQEAPESFQILDLVQPLGISVSTAREQKLAYVLGILNRILPGPVLLFNAQDGVYLKQSFIQTEEDELWPGLLLESLAYFKDLAPVLSHELLAVAENKQTAEAAIKNLEQALAKPPAGRGPLFQPET